MNVDNENQHSSSRSLSVSSTFDTIFCWAHDGKACCAGQGLCRMLDSVRCCKFDPFYSSLPKQTAPWAHSSSAPFKLAAPWPRRVCLLTTILVPSCVCSDHCHQSPASGCWPLPLVHHWHLMTSWLLLSRQNLIVLKYHLLVKHHTSTSQR